MTGLNVLTKNLKILHILDHSIPLHSGYTFRTRAILEQQKELGWKTFHVTSAKHSVAEQAIEEVDGYPRVKPELCIGCGICENVCPVRGSEAAIKVYAPGTLPEQGSASNWGPPQ